MFDTNDGVVAGGPGTPQTQYGTLNPKVDFANEPLVSMAPGSRYIRLKESLNNCGWQINGGQMWFKCSAGGGSSCDENAPLAGPDDWERIACKMIFQGEGAPTGEALCQEAEIGDFYFIPDSEGGVARIFIKWKDGCDDSDWFELCPPKGNHPPAEITWGPGAFSADVANQKFHIPRLQISQNKGLLSLDPVSYKLNLPPKHYIGIRYPQSQPVQIVPKEVLTPIAMYDVVVDTTGAHPTSGNELCLPCDGVWEIRARAWFKHPFGDGSDPDSPADLGFLSADASMALFIGRNGATPAYAREWSPMSTVISWYLSMNVARTECLGAGDKFTLFAYWEDRGSGEVLELELTTGSISAEFVVDC